jgi:hypothetical protein
MGNLDLLSLRVLDRNIRVYCKDAEARALLLANYGQMQVNLEPADLNYTIGRDKSSGSFFVSRGEQKSLMARQGGEFLYLFEQDITVQLQKLRRDLYFVHSAVLEFEGKACMLVGPNNSGKSTTAWALLHHSFRYLSDELGPVDPKTLQVHPYPRALWLRREPPGPHQLPSHKIQTSWMLCVPPESFPNGVSRNPTTLGAIFFVRYSPAAARPSCRLIGKAEAAGRILANALNPGAHSENGLDAAVEISTRTACFELLTTSLSEACAVIKAALMKSV